MPRRTLADARQSLEEQRPYLSDGAFRRYSERLDAAEVPAREAAEQHVTAREAAIRTAYDAALRDLTATRDIYDDLAVQGGTARIGSREYAEQLKAARARHEGAEATLQKLSERVEALAAVEEDPIAWYDDLAQRMPHLRVEVPW